MALSCFAQVAGAIDVRKRAYAFLALCASTMVGIVRALENMAFVTISTLRAEAEGSERTANRSSRGDIDMGIAACTVRAVAAKEMGASWHAVVAGLVGEVAVASSLAGAGVQEVLADGDFRGIVGESAVRAKRASACNICQYRPPKLNGVLSVTEWIRPRLASG